MRSFEILDALTDMDDELLRRAEMSPPKRRNSTGKRVNLRLFGKIVAIAAVLTSLMITVYAADTAFGGGELFGGFFGGAAEKQGGVVSTTGRPYAEKEYTYPKKENTKKNVLTSNGATITPLSSVTDGRTCYLHFRLEAPEGVVLPDLPEDKYYSFTGNNYLSERIEVDFTFEGHAFDELNVEADVLPDSDPTDNVKEFLLELYAPWSSGFYAKTFRVSIPGLWVRGSTLSEEYRNYLSKVFGAEFEFDVTPKRVEQKIDLKDLGVSHYVEKHDFTLNLERIIITSLRLEVHYTATLPENEDILPDGSYAQIVMKDGTILTYGDRSNVSDGPDVGYQVLSKAGEYYGLDFRDVAREYNLDTYAKYSFAEPIVLEDIDYIVWCGGNVIDVN